VLRWSSLPRVLPKHLGPEADAYREYVLGLLDRLGVPLPLPRGLVQPVREAGSAHLDLWRLRQALEALEARCGAGSRPKEERRLRGEIRKTRIQVKWLEHEARVAAKSMKREPTVDELLDRIHAHPGESHHG